MKLLMLPRLTGRYLFPFPPNTRPLLPTPEEPNTAVLRLFVCHPSYYATGSPYHVSTDADILPDIPAPPSYRV